MRNQLVKVLVLSVSINLMTSICYGSTVTGTLVQGDNGAFKLVQLSGEELELEIPRKYLLELPSLSKNFLDKLKTGKDKDGNPLNYPDFFMTFEGEREENKFIAVHTPQIGSGTRSISGKLRSDGKDYFINDKQVHFETSVKVNGASFDKKSIDFYINKNVSVMIKEANGDLLITAIVPTDVYSAKKIAEVSAKSVKDFLGKEIERELIVYENKLVYGNGNIDGGDLVDIEEEFIFSEMGEADLSSKIDHYALDFVYKDVISRGSQSFRETLLDNGTSVKAGDVGLIITSSGRQGEDTGTLGGHFAAGSVKVKDDLSLEGELWNFYPNENEKKILSGHNNFVDYFGNLTSGQSNYRPTYSIIIYGVSKEILKQIRDKTGEEFYKLREDATIEASAYYNCTTVTVDALDSVRIDGTDANSIVGDVVSKAVGGVVFAVGTVPLGAVGILGYEKPWSMKRSLEYSLLHDPSVYLPRTAFDGYLSNIVEISKKLNATRVDYIFHAQTPSSRAVGGVASGHGLTIKKGVDLKMTAGKKKKGESCTQKEIDDVINHLMN